MHLREALSYYVGLPLKLSFRSLQVYRTTTVFYPVFSRPNANNHELFSCAPPPFSEILDPPVCIDSLTWSSISSYRVVRSPVGDMNENIFWWSSLTRYYHLVTKSLLGLRDHQKVLSKKRKSVCRNDLVTSLSRNNEITRKSFHSYPQRGSVV